MIDVMLASQAAKAVNGIRTVGDPILENKVAAGADKAWQRAMEAEQNAAWFKKTTPQLDQQTRATSFPAQREITQTPFRSSSAEVVPARQQTVASAAEPKFADAPSIDHSAARGRAFAQHLSKLLETPHATVNILPSNRLPGAMPSSAQPTCKLESDGETQQTMQGDTWSTAPEADQAPRIHAEWAEHGVRIWIGVDQRLTITSAQRQQLMQELLPRLQQWLTEQHRPLLSVVCNGKLMWLAPTNSADVQADVQSVTAINNIKE